MNNAKKSKKKTPAKRMTKMERRSIEAHKTKPDSVVTANGWGGEVGVEAGFNRVGKNGERIATIEAYDNMGDPDDQTRFVSLSFNDSCALRELADVLNAVADWMDEDQSQLPKEQQ
jgi:hypothetical protein